MRQFPRKEAIKRLEALRKLTKEGKAVVDKDGKIRSIDDCPEGVPILKNNPYLSIHPDEAVDAAISTVIPIESLLAMERLQSYCVEVLEGLKIEKDFNYEGNVRRVHNGTLEEAIEEIKLINIIKIYNSNEIMD